MSKKIALVGIAAIALVVILLNEYAYSLSESNFLELRDKMFEESKKEANKRCSSDGDCSFRYNQYTFCANSNMSKIIDGVKEVENELNRKFSIKRLLEDMNPKPVLASIMQVTECSCANKLCEKKTVR